MKKWRARFERGQGPSAPTRRNRHGRSHRGPMAWPPAPAMLTRRERFDEAVLASVEAAERRTGVSLQDVEIGVEDVPPSDVANWEDSVSLGRAFSAERGQRARIVLYRMPITTRASSPRELEALVDHVVRSQLAGLLGYPFTEDDE